MGLSGYVSMNFDANEGQELADEEKDTKDRELGDGQSSFKDNSLKADEDNEEWKDGTGVGVQDQSIMQVQQRPLPPPQGTVVCWERFLHVQSIKVLLVENDDSTRHVVTALLRNCNYEVLEAANGLQAWKIIEDLTNHIDLILMEVVMPCVSGIGLLCKIMSHKTRKNIPVIVMSSHDSRGLVFKCLSKGAVDFLVKPIRKNELKNLWQHVWRRFHSSSGSGSESGTPTQKSVKSKCSDKSDNNSGSNDGENNGSNGFNVGDGSDDGSGAQSSWTKQAVEVDSHQAMSPRNHIVECPDSTHAQFVLSNAEISGNKKVLMNVAGEDHGEKQTDTVAEDNDCETIIRRNPESRSQNPVEAPFKVIGAKQKSMLETHCSMSCKQIDKGEASCTGEYMLRKRTVASANMLNPHTDAIESESIRAVRNVLDINNDSKEPNLEFSLKRLRGFQDTRRMVQDDCYVLRHSEQPAFSRPVKDELRCTQQQVGLVMTRGMETALDLALVSGSHRECKMWQTHLQNQNHHHHHLHNLEQRSSSNNDESYLKKLVADATHGGSSNLFRPMNAVTRTHSLNKISLGFNHGSTGQTGSSTDVKGSGTIAESDVGQVGESGSGNRTEKTYSARRYQISDEEEGEMLQEKD